jgi:hypothetical protein
MEFVTRELYGGAFTIDIPKCFADISEVREVPNHQEVFADSDTDRSIIVELNSMAEVPDNEACVYLFNDLMGDSDAASQTIDKTGPIDLKRT